MMKVIIAPYSARRHNGQPCAKDYPVRWWTQVVAKLNAMGVEVIQIGVAGETRIEGVSQFIVNWPLKKLRELALETDSWISVDSFWPHLIHSERLGKRGVVIWGVSDPAIWGHPENINLLKDRKYLRELQYKDWHEVEYNEAAFVLPHVVIEAVQQILAESTKSADGHRSVSSSVFVETKAEIQGATWAHDI